MDLGILPVFVKGRSQGNVLGNELVPRAFLDFRDLETPPALNLALPTKALFLRPPSGNRTSTKYRSRSASQTGPFEKSLRDSTPFNLSSASFEASEK